MSAPAAAAAATSEEDTAAAPVKASNKKKLLLMIAIVLVLLIAGGGGGAFWYMKKKAAAAAAAAEEGGAEAHAAPTHDPKHAPSFIPLEPFVVNLADRDVDRYAQIGITFELDDSGAADQIKAYMPAIRNAILLVLANKTSKDILDRDGKEQLAEEIKHAAAVPMGLEPAMPMEHAKPAMDKASAAKAADEKASSGASAVAAKGEVGKASDATKGDAAKPQMAKASGAAIEMASAMDDDPPAAKKHGKDASSDRKNPIQHVHFSSFIVQ